MMALFSFRHRLLPLEAGEFAAAKDLLKTLERRERGENL